MSSSTDAIEIRVPRETVNDDLVTIAKWHVSAGDRVSPRQLLITLETSKAAIDVEAEGEGVVEIIAAVGSEVAVGDLVGRIRAGSAAPVAVASSPSPTPEISTTSSGGPQFSRKARALLTQYAIPESAFSSNGLIREAEVIQYLEKQAAAAPAKSDNGSPAPATPIDTKIGGGMFDARAAASDRGKSIVWVAWNYFWRNWLLGNLVRWAPRGIILPLHRWRGVKMGKGCFIDPTAIVETAYPENVSLGDDVRITAGCVIMTHIKAPHYLRQTGLVPMVLKPVRLEDHCFIGVNSVIMPGVTVGKASVVTSGSVVLGNVPPFTMVSGNPAKVVRQFPKPRGEA